jgi:glycine/betaine/sarcosine/D-proline reductase family selenoprotein B
MVGVNRILRGMAITNVLGDGRLTKEEEKLLRRKYVLRALEILSMDVKEQKVFTLDGME